MTTGETMHAIGKTVVYPHGTLRIEVNVLDIKTTWGQVRALIVPIAGTGTVWVDIKSLLPISTTTKGIA
jgi:Na+-transporting NADH:ubiquinone oxidoreductase subunit NqrC